LGKEGEGQGTTIPGNTAPRVSRLMAHQQKGLREKLRKGKGEVKALGQAARVNLKSGEDRTFVH